MRHLLSRVKRLQRLAALESAARLGSFTAAAEELGVTQPAVTRQVRALESELGIALFRRSANRAILSDAGHRLHRSVDRAFAGIESELDRIGLEQSVFVLAANPGVAQRWLVPYLSGLKAAAGDAEVRLWLFDRNAELARGSYDAAIHAGEGSWPNLRCRLLFPEIVVPVATPGHAARRGLTAHTPPSKLLDATLLHLDDEDRPWMSWATWFGHFELDLPTRSSQVIYNNYALVLEEAVAGNGVALAWRYLIDDQLERGTLVTVGPEVRQPTSGYYLLWPESAPSSTLHRVAEWLEGVIGAPQNVSSSS